MNQNVVPQAIAPSMAPAIESTVIKSFELGLEKMMSKIPSIKTTTIIEAMLLCQDKP
jgi:hypothetical protein